MQIRQCIKYLFSPLYMGFDTVISLRFDVPNIAHHMSAAEGQDGDTRKQVLISHGNKSAEKLIYSQNGEQFVLSLQCGSGDSECL